MSCSVQLSALVLAVWCVAALGTPRPQAEPVGVGQIVLGSSAEASQVHAQLVAGVPFELLAREQSLDAFTAARGGFLGRFSISDLRPEFARALADLSPGDVSAVVEIDPEYFILKRLTAAETDWAMLEDTGLRAAEQGRGEAALDSFEAALDLAGEFGPQDPRVARSLANLGELHRIRGNLSEAESFLDRSRRTLEELARQEPGFQIDLAQTLNSLGLVLSAQQRFSEAEPLYRQTLAIRENVRGASHPEVAIALNNLAELYFADRRYAEAGPLYERAVNILTDALGPGHSATASARNNLIAFREALLPEVLERFAEIVFFATFQDETFQAGLSEFEAMLSLTPLAEESYVEMKDAFFQADLFDLAENVLRRGIERFPDSRTLPFHLGELLDTLGRTRDALEVFEGATRLSPADLDPTTDMQQLGLLHRRMGDMHTILSEFDQAEAAYVRALEIDPNTPSGHVSFGQMYFLSNRLEEALEQYELARAVNPDDFALQVNLAEVYVALTRWSEAAAAAERAQQLDPDSPRGLYLRGTALVRMGETEEGRQQLQEFARREQETQAVEHESREAEAINSDAVAALIAGDAATAMNLFERGIAQYPEDRPLRVNLGLAHMRLGQHREAVQAWETIVDLEISDHYLIFKKLAEAYEALGDSASADRYRDSYTQKRDAELGTVLVFDQ